MRKRQLKIRILALVTAFIFLAAATPAVTAGYAAPGENPAEDGASGRTRTVGSQTDGSQTVGSEDEGSETEGSEEEGLDAAGSLADTLATDPLAADPLATDTETAATEQAANTAGSQAVGSQAVGSQAVGSQAAGPVAAVSAPVSDLSASYADLTQEEKAEILNRLGVLLGDPDRGLMLDIMVRRSDAAVFFTRLLGREQYVKDRSASDFAVSRFPDAPEGAWFTPYISFCTSIGIIAGRTDGYYYPDDNISEKEFANVLLKILGYEYESDYNWDTVYSFSYDIGLFEDQAYETKTGDNREYYRRDVCDQVFAVLSLQKKGSNKLLIEDLIENGAISEAIAAGLDFDLSGLSNPTVNIGTGTDYSDVDADIYDIYHLEPTLLWVIFTKPVTFRDESIEICQTYDYSKILTARVEEKTERDLLLRTGEQQNGMDYTIDISNVIEANGANAGMLSYDFIGYNPNAQRDTPGGLTSLTRNVSALPGAPSGGTGTQTAAGEGPQDDGEGDGAEPDGGSADDGASPSGGSAAPGPQRPSGNAAATTDYFRLINAYTTAANEMHLVFSHPVTETALNSSFYNIVQGSSILCSGSAGQITAALAEGAVNTVRLTLSGFAFARGEQYKATVSGRLTSSYTARLNEGGEDSYTFTAENVEEKNDNFSVHSIEAPTAYIIDFEFTHPLNAGVARQAYNYIVQDKNGGRIEIASVAVSHGGSVPAASVQGDGENMRVTLQQPLLINQIYTFKIIFAQNSDMTASITDQTYQVQYKGIKEAPKKSPIALTGASSNDPSSVELYFTQKLDPVSAVIASNYVISGLFNGRNYNVTPIKISYDPILTPYKVRLYMQSDRRFSKDYAYSMRVNATIRDENMLNPERPLDIQFFANNRESNSPSLNDAVIVGDGIVRLDFYNEIMFDPAKLSEGNYGLIDTTLAGEGSSAAANSDSRISPILVKYINPTTLVLRFESIDPARKYRVFFNSMTDYSGQFTTVYPAQGSTVALRAGKR